MFWLTFGTYMITILVGLEWDRRWHATHPSVFWFLLLAALVTPFATGIVDLSLRKLTP